jgi:hypothetical protein
MSYREAFAYWVAFAVICGQGFTLGQGFTISKSYILIKVISEVNRRAGPGYFARISPGEVVG